MTENQFRNRIIESDLTPNARLVCYVLLQFRNRKTGACYPSQVTISNASGLSPNTVKKATKELVEKGYVSIEKKRESGMRYTSCFYVFNIENQFDVSNDVSLDASIEVSIDGAQIAYKPIEPNEPKKPTERKVKKNTALGDLNTHGLSDNLWDEFKAHRKKRKKDITQRVMDGIKKQADSIGWNINDAVTEVLENQWLSFKAEYIDKSRHRKPKSHGSMTHDEHQAIIDKQMEDLKNGR